MKRRSGDRRQKHHCEMCTAFSNRWAMEKKRFHFDQRQNQSVDSKRHKIEELKSDATSLQYFFFWLKEWMLLIGTIIAFALWFEVLL